MRASDPDDGDDGATRPLRLSGRQTITDTGTADPGAVDALAATTGRPGGGDDALIGTTIGRYRVTARLGAGGMGVVYAALDPALDRKVALKVLPPLDDARRADLEARLRREAQALARVDHDHVVKVFDVGVAAQSLFVAMQLVEGPTLADLLADERPPPRRVLELFTAAARGLAAAHAAGIVHRDFKPSNVLVDRAGRVCVGDFGLARADDASDDAGGATATSGALGERMTRAGAVMGTPLYMAPEQHRGEPATARSDQFGFCVSLWEALFEEHPFFTGRWNLAAVTEAMARDEVREPADRRGVSPRLIRALRRGMRHDPEQRWPAMPALIEELAPRSRRGAVAAGLGLAAVVGGVALTLALTGDRDPAASCRAGADRVAAVWPARAGELDRVFAAAPIPEAAATGERVDAMIGRYATRWRQLRVDACEASHVRGDTTPALRDVQLRCLDDDLRVLGQLIDDLAGAAPPVLARAVDAVAALPELDDCSAAALAPMTPPPAGALVAISEVRAEIARARTLAGTGQYAEARPILEAAVARAEEIGYPPLLARALDALANTLFRVDSSEAGAMAERAAEIATAAHADEVAADAMMVGLTIAAERPDLPRVAVLLPLARAAAQRTGNPDTIAEFAVAAGYAAVASADHDRAIALCEETLAVMTRPERAADDDAADTARTALNCLSVATLSKGDVPAAAAWTERLLAASEAHYGAGSFATAIPLQHLGLIRRRQGKTDEAIALARRALALFEQVLGEDVAEVGTLLTTLAQLEHEARRPADGIPYAERALAIAKQRDQPPGVQTVSAELTLAQLLDASDRRAEMHQHLELAQTLAEKVLAPDDGNLAVVRFTRAKALAEDGEIEPALALLAEVSAAFERTGNPRAATVAGLRAEILISERRFAEAIPILEAVVATLEASRGDALNLLMLKLTLADALWESRIDRKRARALVGQARAAAVARGDSGAQLVAECDRWLGAH